MTTRFRNRCLIAGALLIFVASSVMVAAPPTEVPAAQVKVSGITTLFGDKRAILVITEPGTTSKDAQSCVLKEGETSGSVKVLQIDVDAGRVRIENGGKQSEISFSQNGIAPLVAAPVAPRVSTSTAAMESPAVPPAISVAQVPSIEAPPPQTEFESQPQTDLPEQLLVIGRQRDRVAEQSIDPMAPVPPGGMTRGIPPVKQFGRPVATPRDVPLPDMSSLPEFMTNRYGRVMDSGAPFPYPVPAHRGFAPRQPSTPAPVGPPPTMTGAGSAEILIELQREQSSVQRSKIIPPTRFSRDAPQ